MTAPARPRPGGLLATPVPWLAALLAAYLLVPLAGFGTRLARTPAHRLGSPGLWSALAVSVETATIATAVVTLLGVPLGYVLARGRGRTSTWLGVLVQLPLALPPLMSGILLLYLVGPASPVGAFFGGQLTDDRAGIVLAQAFVSAPFLVVAARSAFAAVDPALPDVAATLGHGAWSRFRRVALPVAAPGIGAGVLLAWLRAFGEFGATIVLAYHPFSLPVLTYVQFGGYGLDATLLPVAAGLATAVVVLGLAHLAPRWRRRAAPAALPAAHGPVAAAPARLEFDVRAHLGGFRLAAAASGRHIAVLGASGAGKTLTLRALAGLVPLDAGAVAVGGVALGGAPPERRAIGYLPQDAALLPHLPVWRQVTFGVGSDPAVAAYWLDRLGLAGLETRLPSALSGGQRRRVALARALARQPRVLLLDEPFTGLDTPARHDLRGALRRLQRSTTLTTVVVTHDPDDAALLADEVVLLDGGRVLQCGPQAEVFARPASAQAARLLGARNLLAGAVAGPESVTVAGLLLPAPGGQGRLGAPVTWHVPPQHVAPGGPYPAEVVDRVHHGGHDEIAFALADGQELVAFAPAGTPVTDSFAVDSAAVITWG